MTSVLALQQYRIPLTRPLYKLGTGSNQVVIYHMPQDGHRLSVHTWLFYMKGLSICDLSICRGRGSTVDLER